ncbi:MAG: transaldolase family protein [Candidatus Babeliaceae bacterium]
MKIFLDTADVASIKKLAEKGVIDGITTNPTSLSKETGLPTDIILQICKILPQGSISVEITEKSPSAVYDQAKKIAALAENIVVKIPCYKDYYPIIKKLVDEGIKINITLLFSVMQGLMMAKLGVWYVSPFIGRLDDCGQDGLDLIRDLRTIFDEYEFETEILAASIRSVYNFQQTALAGADIATVPIKVFEQALEHPLTDKGMAQFDTDWQKLGIKQFP